MKRPRLSLLILFTVLFSVHSFSQFTVSATASTSTICLGSSTQLTATASPISYAGSSVPFNPLPSLGTDVLCSGGVTLVPRSSGINLDDCRWDNISIPFTFTYFGNNYTQLNISSNGWIGLGATNSTTTGFNAVVPSTTPANNVIFGMLTDLTFSGGSGGSIEYFEDGYAPNRSFVILYSGAKFVSGGGLADIEIILYEGTNAIDIYTDMITANTTQNKTEGIENSGGTLGVAYPGRNNVANWNSTGAQTGYHFEPETINYSWSPAQGLSSTSGKVVTATPSATTTYTVTATNAASTVATNTVTVTINPASNTPAGVAGGASIFHNISVSPGGTYYRDISNCNIISYIVPSGVNPVSNSINTAIKVDTGATRRGTSDLYLARKYDIEPLINAATSTATITLYYLQSEFNNFNAKASDSGHKLLPTGSGDATGIGNLIMRQFHGTGTNPSNYTGTYQDLSIATSGFTVVWNSSYSRWEVTVPVNGFSGFYLTSTKSSIVPVKLEYFKGTQINKQHLLTWKSECLSTEAKFTLERSSDGTHYKTITALTASQARCSQPFDYTDEFPASGLNYYRLKTTDPDGKFAYSNIVSLVLKAKGFSLININPNIIDKENALLKVNAGEKAEVSILIIDFSGRIISKELVQLQPGINQVELKTAHLSTGAYQVTAYTADQKLQTLRFIKH